MGFVEDMNVVVAGILANLVGISLGLALLVPIWRMMARPTRETRKDTEMGWSQDEDAARRLAFQRSMEEFRAEMQRLAEHRPRGGVAGSRDELTYGSRNR